MEMQHQVQEVMSKIKIHTLNRKNYQNQLDQISELDNGSWSVPHIIYASRTHSQLNQAMQVNL